MPVKPPSPFRIKKTMNPKSIMKTRSKSQRFCPILVASNLEMFIDRDDTTDEQKQRNKESLMRGTSFFCLDYNISQSTGKTILHNDFLEESHFLQSLLTTFLTNGTPYQ